MSNYIVKNSPTFNPDHNPDGATKRSFAEQLAADVSGRNWETPEARNFKDLEPSRRSERLSPKTWHPLSEILADVLHDVADDMGEAA